MKKLCLLPLLVFATHLLIAQVSPQQRIDSVCRLVQQYFNEKSIDKLYELTGESFRKSLPQETFKSVCVNNLFPLGEMKKTEFESHTNGVSRYKAIFPSMNLALVISLDKAEKIETFLFSPYTDLIGAKKNDKVPSSNPLVTALDKKLDSTVQSYISLKATTGLSIGILKDGKSIFYGYGETARGNQQLPNEHTLFEIGSLSKTFTSILLADAVNRGKVKLEDPVNNYLPDSIPLLQYGGITVTLKTLANHSSGIPRMPSNFHSSDNENPYKDYDRKDLFSFYKSFTPVRKPGEKYEYSNLAVGTLGVILEDVNHSSYEALLTKTICKPLHMFETKVLLLATDTLCFAKGYKEDGSVSSQWDFKALGAAGCIRSTSADLIKFAKANLGDAPPALNKDIKLTHLVTFTENKTKLGLAWHIIQPGTDAVYFHNGQTGGYHSYFAVNLKKKFAVVILSNCAIGTEEIGGAIMKWLETNQ